MEEYREEFEKRIEKKGDCWLWRGWIGGSAGHPRLQLPDGQIVSARWVAWVLHGGLRCERYLYAKCRNSKCVNPDHLVPRTSNSGRDQETYGERLRKGQQMIDGDMDEEVNLRDLVGVDRGFWVPGPDYRRDSQNT